MSEQLADLDGEIQRLEQLTSEVVQALTEARPADVQRLVIEQCECIQRINASSVRGANVPRMRRIAEMVELQQVLIRQALQTADHFIKSIRVSGTYNQLV